LSAEATTAFFAPPAMRLVEEHSLAS
jgi:hypothetical protein